MERDSDYYQTHMFTGFNEGYRKAIQDVIEVFQYEEDEFKFHHKQMNAKLSIELLKCILENREPLRDKWNGFFRYHWKGKRFEWYTPNKQKGEEHEA